MISWRLHYNYQYWKQKKWIPISSKSAYVHFELMPLEKDIPFSLFNSIARYLEKKCYTSMFDKREWVRTWRSCCLINTIQAVITIKLLHPLSILIGRRSSGIHKHSCMPLCQTESIVFFSIYYMHYRRKSRHFLFYNQ